MSDDQVRVTILCNRQLKKDIRSAVIDMDFKNFQDGYKELIQIGLDNYKKDRGIE